MITSTNKKDDFKVELSVLKNSVDPLYLLTSLGFNIARETPKEIRCTCNIHGGDNTTAFRFNKERNTWVCFTNKCHELHGNDVIALVMCVLNYDFSEAVNYIKNMVGDIDNQELMFNLYSKTKEQEQFIKHYSDPTKPWYVDEERLLNFYIPRRSDYFIKHGFSKDTLDFFEVGGGWQEEDGTVRDIIPIRGEDGELLAFSRRDITSISNFDDKYKSTHGFERDNCLYNLHNAKQYLHKLPLILVEGYKSVWRLHEYGIKNVAAVMGSSITSGQQMLLLSYALKGVVTFFDNDMAGINGTVSAYESLSSKLEFRPVFICEVDENGVGLDPADLSREEVYDYLKTYY